MNAYTGDNPDFYYQIKKSIQNAERIDIIVSILMESGIKLLIKDLKIQILKLES